MTARIVVLNGPAGVGKSTVSRALTAQTSTAVWVQGDALRGFAAARTDEAVPRELTCRTAGTLAANLVAAGHELVVFDFIFHHDADVRRFLDGCSASVPVHFFTLWASLESVIQRERGRPVEDRWGERVEACYYAIESVLGSWGQVIDTDGLSAEAVAWEVHDLCAGDRARIDSMGSGPVETPTGGTTP